MANCEALHGLWSSFRALVVGAFAWAVVGCGTPAPAAADIASAANDALMQGETLATPDGMLAVDSATAPCPVAGQRWCEQGRAVEAGPACATPTVSEDCLWAGKQCYLGHCLDEVCGADGYGCDGGQVVRCLGEEVQVVENCAGNGGVCLHGSCTHPQCAQFGHTCKAGTVWACNPKTGAYDSAAGTCTKPDLCTGIGCLPGCSTDYKASPLQCSPDGKAAYDCSGSSWSGAVPVSIQLCLPPTTACVAGQCVEPCKTSGTSCLNDHTVLQCTDGKQPKAKVCAQPTPDCLDGNCVHLCSGAPSAECQTVDYTEYFAVVCDGGATAKVTECEGAVCKEGNCVAKQCMYGEKTCQGNNVSSCDYSGFWAPPVPCGLGTYCSDGICSDRPCALGATGCSGAALAVCGTSSVDIQAACPQGSVCEGGACLANCSANWARCEGSTALNCAQGAPPASQNCSSSGNSCQHWFGQAACLACNGTAGCAGAWTSACGYKPVPDGWCPPPANCSGGSCSVAKVNKPCDAADQCQGDGLMQCNPATGKLEQTRLCAGARVVCSTWNLGCTYAKCHPGLATCVGNAVETCADSYSNVSQSPCAADKVCQDGACTTPACQLPTWAGVPGMRVVGLQWLPAGQGCDLDAAAGPDNQAHRLAPWLPPAALQAGLALGSAASFVAVSLEATPTLSVFAAWHDPTAPDPPWTALADTFDRTKSAPACLARTALAQGKDGWFHGGQALQWLPLRIGSAEIRVPLAQLRAKLGDGTNTGEKTLQLCGWIPKALWNQQVVHLPVQTETLLGLSAEQLQAHLDADMPPLGDPDGDGVLDATPVAFGLLLKL